MGSRRLRSDRIDPVDLSAIKIQVYDTEVQHQENGSLNRFQPASSLDAGQLHVHQKVSLYCTISQRLRLVDVSMNGRTMGFIDSLARLQAVSSGFAPCVLLPARVGDT
jgi:hypothetical protein